MSILILNSSRNTDVPYEEWLAESGEELLLLCSSRQERVSDRYQAVRKFENYETNACVEAAALELFDKHRYRVVIAKAEADLLRAGRLRDVVGVAGQGWESARAYRDKTVMKTYTQKAGVPTPIFQRIETAFDLLSFVKRHGYPVFVKPVDGSGSMGTEALRGPADLERLLAGGLPHNLEVEQFIEGEMYHVDGVVLDGQTVLMQPSRYLNGGCLAFKSDNPCGSYTLPDTNPLKARLSAFTQRVIDALPSPPTFTFHAEVFHTPSDELVFCEIASRTGGGRINETVRQACGVNMDRLWIRAQCGLPVDAQEVRRTVAAHTGVAGWLMLPPRNAVLESLPETAPAWISEYWKNAAPGTNFAGPAYARRKSGDYIASIIVKADTEAQVQERLADSLRWLDGSIRWTGRA
jgi:biotin carboxylase